MFFERVTDLFLQLCRRDVICVSLLFLVSKIVDDPWKFILKIRPHFFWFLDPWDFLVKRAFQTWLVWNARSVWKSQCWKMGKKWGSANDSKSILLHWHVTQLPNQSRMRIRAEANTSVRRRQGACQNCGKRYRLPTQHILRQLKMARFSNSN